MSISYQDFENVDMRVGRVISAEDFPEAKKAAYKLKIDLGEELGVKNSSAQITGLYRKEDLIGKEVLCVVNFQPKQVGKFMSEVLTLGVDGEDKNVVLVGPDREVKPGVRIY